MPVEEPDLPMVEQAIIDLLFEQQVASLATLSEDGHPSTSAMHIASDRLIVYVHTFVRHRKYGEMLRDPRVSYATWYLPTGGFNERDQIRSVQVKGKAVLVTEPEELQRAVDVSRQQFPWLQSTSMYDNLKVPSEGTQQVFFRIEPIEAVWADHRVHVLWWRFLTFTPDGRHIAQMRPYNEVAMRKPPAPPPECGTASSQQAGWDHSRDAPNSA